jgi:hypothetical protein
MGGGGELESGGAPSGDRSTSFWVRVRSHEIIQWGIGYLGAALALAQGAELVGNTFDWPDVVGRILMLALIAGLPVALALAWYHGHRGLQRVSTEELGVLSALILIGAVFFGVSFRLTDSAGANAPTSANAAEAIRRPVYRDMRKLPRFKELVRQIGLVDYWKQYGWPDVCRPFGENDFECD